MKTMKDVLNMTRLELKPSDLKIALGACFKARKPVMVVSSPGVGKTSIGHQATIENGFKWLVCNPALEDPTEPGGFPWFKPEEKHARKFLFGQLWKAVNATEPTTLWIEDFGGAAEATQKAYMQWIEAREVDGQRLSDFVTIGLATNERGQKSGVSGVLETVKGRVTILYLKSDLEDFCSNLFERGATEYGLTEDAMLAGAFHLRNNPDRLNAFEPTADMTNSPTERNWTNGFAHICHGLPPHIETALVAGRVGAGDAASFMATVDLLRKQKAFSIDAILMDPNKAPIPEGTSAQWVVAKGLAARIDESNLHLALNYLERYEKANLGEFAAVCVQDATRRCPRITQTMTYIERLVPGPIGRLISGKVA